MCAASSVRDKKDNALTSINNYHRTRDGMTREDAGIDAELMRRGRYGVFFGGKNSSNKLEIKIVGKKRHQWWTLASGVQSCVEPWPLGCSRVRCLGRGDTGIDAKLMWRGRYGIFSGGKNSSNKFEIKIVGKKRH